MDGGIRIPAKTHLAAICKIGDRLELQVRSLEMNGRIVPLALSCQESSGLMHTFLVAYREHPSRLDVDTRSDSSFARQTAGDAPSVTFNFDEIIGMKQELYHIGARDELSAPRFAVESRRRTRRGLQYEKAVFPRQSYGLGATAPDAVGKMVFTFDKIALTRGQVFRVYFYENGGSRNFVLTFGAKDVNGARRL